MAEQEQPELLTDAELTKLARRQDGSLLTLDEIATAIGEITGVRPGRAGILVRLTALGIAAFGPADSPG